MTMLMKYDIFSEDVSRFYMAECILAIEAVHKLGYIHRYEPSITLKHFCLLTGIICSDIKPDNILIDKNGHLKLSDFGLSTGLHKTSDRDVYKRLLDQEKQRDPARNSVQVNSINLTMSREQIATWKANRRKLVCILTVPCSFYRTLIHCTIGIFYSRHPRLHCSGSILLEWVRQRM